MKSENWITSDAILSCPSLGITSKSGLFKKADRENWIKRRNKESKRGLEFLIQSLPQILAVEALKIVEKETKRAKTPQLVKSKVSRKVLQNRINVLSPFLPFYQTHKNLTVAAAWRQYKEHQEAAGLPYLKYEAVRKALKKLPIHMQEKGRKTGSSMKSLLSYVRRDWSVLDANDCWAGDGHALHAKIKHPLTGRAFRPEITLIIDCSSRFVVGWSISFAESHLAVAEALYRGMKNHGIPLIYYYDNGGGQSNQVFDNEIAGIFSRLDVKHCTSLPANPQGRGIIERLMRSLAKDIALALPTYFHRSADQEKVRKILYAVESGAKANAEGRPLTPIQQKGINMLPSWEDLEAVMEQKVNEYNNTPHFALNGKTPAQSYSQKVSKLQAEGNYFDLTETEASSAFKPSFIRKVQRGWIVLNRGYYWSEELEDYNQQEVICLIDLTDYKTIEVLDLKHRFICTAELEKNSARGMPQSYIEQQREQRKQRRVRKLEDEWKKANQEKQRVLELNAQEEFFSVLENLNSANNSIYIEPKSQEEKKEEILLKVLGIDE